MKRLCVLCGLIVEATEFRAHQKRHSHARYGRPGSTRAWRQLRERILERDGHRCTVCGAVERLEVDHINGNWRDNRPENLRTVCFDHNPRGRALNG